MAFDSTSWHIWIEFICAKGLYLIHWACTLVRTGNNSCTLTRNPSVKEMKTSLAIGLIALMVAGASQAAHITVKGKCTLARAIMSANTDRSRFCKPGYGPDTIGFPAKTRIVLTKLNNRFGYGLPIIRSAIAINGKGSVIVRGGKAPAMSLFGVDRPGRLTLNDLTLSTSGLKEDKVGNVGIAMRNFGTAVLNRVTVVNSYAGVINDGSMFINDSLFTKNIDGALDSGSASSGADVNLVVRNSRFIGNHGFGAAVSLGETATISNSIIANNVNTAPWLGRNGGGGVGIDMGGSVTIIDSTITNNTSQQGGGGISIVVNSSLSLIRSVVSGNHSPTAPEIYVQDGSTVVSDNNNVIGQKGESGVVGFVPSPSDTVPKAPVEKVVAPDGTPAPDSPAIDSVTDGTVQDPNAVDGNGDGAAIPDAGAVEAPAPDQSAVEPVQPEPQAATPVESEPVVAEVVEEGVVNITNM
jgi:hypothetical protein